MVNRSYCPYRHLFCLFFQSLLLSLLSAASVFIEFFYSGLHLGMFALHFDCLRLLYPVCPNMNPMKLAFIPCNEGEPHWKGNLFCFLPPELQL